MKARYAIKIAAGAILAAAGIFLPFLIDGIEALSSILVTIGLVTIAVVVMRYWRFRDELESDERTKKLGAYGLSYSWLLTLIFLAILFWVDYLGLLALPVGGVLLVTILLMALSARLFQWYFFRRGDVA
ncbi:hypothetical protein BN140_1445 [Methanoculleus bourgensis MS2]|jgi:hypothetical protein|uniref:DUF2178 domain-containing protein n=1 Tax=Methanoculleus bourgensis (strain ATCC 43281 / DSM 3045 / OCM 15 / MS2) TaxID=1201294 RepID=I7J8Y3_METBM|nr:hypothetical protein [Methanoculleus bourgensis]CCJ36368.1 hypothetical protein BN140_1445 [Methanoculleus bourgensis MS2]